MQLVTASDTVGSSAARSVKVATLAQLLSAVAEAELGLAVSYLSGELPQGKLGVGYAKVAAQTAPPASEATLSVLEVDETFSQIANQAGKGANTERARLLSRLLAKATAAEQDFLRRLVVGELRQGALQGVMTDAVAKAYELPLAVVRRAAMLDGNLARVAQVAQREGQVGLERIGVQLLRPLAPMLADTASDVAQALQLLPQPIIEYKLDGVRIQVHKNGDLVKVFTRNLNDVSARLPALVSWVRALPVSSLIVDGELLGLRPDGRPEPFQVTMQRFGRRTVETLNVPSQGQTLQPFFFDLLHAEGEDYIDHPLRERTRALAAIVPQTERVPQRVTADVGEAQAFFAAALAAGHEGVMVKAQHGLYEAGRRGSLWLKVKPAHTLDLVVLAAEWGSGRRKGTLSNLHLGARDPDTGGWVMLGKTFKGLTDELLAWQTQALLSLQLRRDGHVVHVRPELVVEIAFDGIQQSKQYPGGVALRFARVRGYRPDKPASEADTIETVRALIRS